MFVNKRLLIIGGILGVLVVVALGFVTFLLLNQPSASASNGNAASTPTVVATATHSTANRVCATGVISAVDAQNSTFVVTEAKGNRTITVTADAQTTFHKRGDSGVTFNSLAVGQRVRITAQGTCDTTAVSFTAKAITIVVPGTATPGAVNSPTATP